MSVEFTACTYQYRRGAAVLDRLDLTFPPGKTVLLGPNGAGKSTLLALAASALAPSSGTVSYGGLNPASRAQRKEYRRRVGWMPQEIEAMPGMTAREQVAYAGWLKGMSRSRAWEAAVGALDAVSLANKADSQSSALSGGQRRRVGVAQTLVHGAEMILMDEPTAGLDPAQRRVFRGIIERLSEHAHVIVSTHQTEDLSDLYENVVVLEDGQVRFMGSVSEFVARAPKDVAPGRTAEGAYEEILRSGELR
ncbi:ATP-binding cassette domain-containing protein [Streptomyces sp. NPDC091212]|uniref:ATP-binding cassette domain-containing protein n=1 Tax=Streptomyces sp. NPDC091212 TaxID=3155191 RepID=UPI00342FA31E